MTGGLKISDTCPRRATDASAPQTRAGAPLQRIIHGIRFGHAAVAYSRYRTIDRAGPAPSVDVSA